MKKIKLLLMLAAASMSMMATTYTSLNEYSFFELGDVFAPTELAYLNFGAGSLAAGESYTLVRGNIASGSGISTYTGVEKAADGAYYMFEDGAGNLYPPTKDKEELAVTSSTDGIEVYDYFSVWDYYTYSFRSRLHVDEFVDNADGIESGLAALVGQTVNLAINRTFYKDGYFNTICLPISLDAAAISMDYRLWDCEIFEFESASVNGGTLELFVNQVYAIEAGKPYLIRWNEDLFTPDFTGLVFYGVTIETSEGQAVGTGVQFVGSMGKTQLENGNHDYLFVGANNTLYWPNTDNKLKGFRAYFKVSGDVAPHGTPARMVIRKTPTGVENAQSAAVCTTKVLRDGQLIILRNGVEYNAQGQIVK